jgi:hypothetical protein
VQFALKFFGNILTKIIKKYTIRIAGKYFLKIMWRIKCILRK